jgi:hypothetical protein
MLKVHGIFKTQKIEETPNGKKVLVLTQYDLFKDKSGNETYHNTWFKIYITEKSSALFSNDLKKKIAKNKIFLEIDAGLKMGKFDNILFLNEEVMEFIKQENDTSKDEKPPKTTKNAKTKKSKPDETQDDDELAF